jgi:hypothetical protein
MDSEKINFIFVLICSISILIWLGILLPMIMWSFIQHVINLAAFSLIYWTIIIVIASFAIYEIILNKLFKRI